MQLIKKIATTSAIVFGVLLLIASIADHTKPYSDSAGRSGTGPLTQGQLQPSLAREPNLPALTAKTKVHFLNESCMDVARKFGSDASLTSVQQEELWPRYRGQPFDWYVTVVEVTNNPLGEGYIAYFSCVGDRSPSLAMTFPPSLKSEILNFSPGYSGKIEGVLVDYSHFSGLLKTEALLRVASAAASKRK